MVDTERNYVEALQMIVQVHCLIWFFTSQSTIFQLCWDWSSWKVMINVSCSRTHGRDAGEAWTCGRLVSNQALYHWATALQVRVSGFDFIKGRTTYFVVNIANLSLPHNVGCDHYVVTRKALIYINTAFLIAENPQITLTLSLAATQNLHQKLVFKTDYPLMQAKSIAECPKRAFCNAFDLH